MSDQILTFFRGKPYIGIIDREIKRKPSNSPIISINALDFARNKIVDINIIKNIPLTVFNRELYFQLLYLYLLV